MRTLRTGKKDRAPRPGFTLIELMVVLIGLAVVAAAVAPSIVAAGRQGEVDRLAGRVAASARFARATAVEQQAALLLTVETTPAAIRLTWEELADAGPTGGVRGEEERILPLLPGALARVALPARVAARLESAPEVPVPRSPVVPSAERRAPSAALRFPADGRPEGGAIVLTDDRGRERWIVVTPETGVVRIEAGDG